jgi:PAS domain S-box-containing protein
MHISGNHYATKACVAVQVEKPTAQSHCASCTATLPSLNRVPSGFTPAIPCCFANRVASLARLGSWEFSFFLNCRVGRGPLEAPLRVSKRPFGPRILVRRFAERLHCCNAWSVRGSILSPKALYPHEILRARKLFMMRSVMPIGGMIAIGLVITAIAFFIANRAEERRVLRVLELRVEWRVEDLQSKINLSREAIVATAIHAAAKPQIDVAQFHRFTSAAVAGTTSIASIAWVERVDAAQRASFEASAGFPILENGPNGKRVTAAVRDSYAPIVIQNRFDQRPHALGLDLASEPTRRLALALARDSGSPQSVMIPQAAEVAGPTYLTFSPIFDTDDIPTTVNQRRLHLKGYVVGVFRVVDVLNAAIAATPAIPEDLNFYLSNQTDEAASVGAFRIVATYSPPDSRVRVAYAAHVPPRAEYSFARVFSVKRQRWRVDAFFSPGAVAAERSSGPLAILIAGILLTAMLAVHVRRGIRQVSVVQTLVDRGTRELKQTNRKLAALIDASPYAIVCLDAKQRIMLWNSMATDMFGYTEAEVLERPYPLVLPEDRAEFEERFKRVAAGEILRNMPSHRRRKDATTLETSSSAAAFYDSESGLPIGVIFAIEDTSERTRVQNQLRQAQKMEAIGQLTGGLAHDFNNLLGVILGNLDLLAERFGDGGEERELTEAAIQAALRGAELTRQLLAFSRRQPLAPKHIQLAPVLESTGELLRRSLGENVTIRFSVLAGLWPVMVDVSQLESALLNLSVNARDAMPNGGLLTIEATNVVVDERAFELNLEATPGDYVLIAVSDTGCGMSTEILSHAFEPFFTTKGSGGTGLGLSMVHGFIKQSGGYTKIYSEPGHGTTIRIYLPRARQGQESEPDTVVNPTLACGQEMIRVVEDNDRIRDLAVRHLHSLGYRTLSAADGASALEIIRGDTAVDLLFTDMVMPGGVDGRALADAARRERPNLRILFTSGFTAAAAAVSANQVHANLLSKPYRKSELARCIRGALDTQPGAPV